MRALLPRLITLFTCLVPTVLPAQPQDFRIERLELPGGGFISFAQDHDGFMWLGTWGGLHKYDGYEVTTYLPDPADSTSLSYNLAEEVVVDRHGTLWVGTHGGGLNRYDRDTDTFKRYLHDPDNQGSLSDNTVVALLEDHEGTLWVGTRRGLDRFDSETETFTHFRHDPNDPTSLSHDHARVLYEDRQGVLWVGTGWLQDATSLQGGLNRFDRRTGTFTRYLHNPNDEQSLIDSRVTALFEDSGGTFWVGTWGDGLHTMDREAGTFTRHTYDPSHPNNPHRPRLQRGESVPGAYKGWTSGGVMFIHEDRNGQLWIGGMHGGVDCYDPKTGLAAHYEHEPGDPKSLADNQVWSFFESRDGTLWIGTLNGLNKVVPVGTKFPHFKGPHVTHGGIYSIYEDRRGALWMGTWRLGVLFRYDRRTDSVVEGFVHDPTNPNSLGGGPAWAVNEDSSGTLWVGTRGGGLNRFDRESGTFTRYLPDADAPQRSVSSAIVHDVLEDSKGRLWIETHGGGLNLFDRTSGTFTHYRHDPDDPTSLPSDDVLDVVEDRTRTLWVGTTEGLCRFDAEAGICSRSLPGRSIAAIYEDRNGRFWLGSHDVDGLMRFDRSTGDVQAYTAQNGYLPENRVYGILEDDGGTLWIGTPGALTRLDPDDEISYTYHDLEAVPFFWGAFHRSHNGELYAGGSNGFHVIAPEQRLEANPEAPDVTLTRFLLDEEPVHPGAGAALTKPISEVKSITLSHDQNVFSFEFAGLHYRNPEENRHLYLLDGYDDAWRRAGTERRATYVNVPPGEYTFRVKAANADGIWNEEGASVRLSILPPWWQTTWAYVLYGLLFVAGVFATYHSQRRRLLRKEREHAMARELEQAREIESMNRQLRAHEEQLETQNAVLEDQKRRLVELDAVKSRFFANISHEFRTPLTLLLGPLDDALSEPDGELRFPRSQVAAMRRSALRLLHLIDQLLDLSRLESGRMTLRARRTELGGLLRSLVAAFASRAEREEITLQFTASQESLYAYVEPDKLEKVVANLLSNAFKFTPSHGKIRVELEPSNDESGSAVEIVVRDTGQGIPASELPYIFDRFYQVDAASTRMHGGAGIGLALTKELVERHGGTIDVESRPEFGTTFRVRLPLGADHLAAEDIVDDSSGEVLSDAAVEEAIFTAADEEEAPKRAEEMRRPEGAATVLIVEDNADMRSHLRDLLGDRYRLVEAADGEEGLERARETAPALILADVMMPRMDGYALCEAVKTDEQLNHIPVVLLTAKASEESKLEGLETGADDYLYKPFSSVELLARMENLIELRRRLRDRFSGEVRLGPSEVTVPSEEAAFLVKVREAVEAKMGESRFGVDELAEEVGLSIRQLQRRLRAAADLSAAAYIRMMRLERAAQLLEQEAGPISEVAYQVGFKSPEHFSRLFRQVFGVPPSEYHPL